MSTFNDEVSLILFLLICLLKIFTAPVVEEEVDQEVL